MLLTSENTSTEYKILLSSQEILSKYISETKYIFIIANMNSKNCIFYVFISKHSGLPKKLPPIRLCDGNRHKTNIVVNLI